MRIVRCRNPGIDRIDRKVKSLRHHADDGENFPIQRERLAENLRIATQQALPEAVVDDDHAGGAGFIITGLKAAAEIRLYSHDAKEIGGNESSAHAYRFFAPCEIDAAGRKRA